jgi:ribose transport system substrate-binding protein
VQQANPDITGWAMVGGWPLFTDNALKWAPGTIKVVAVDALPAQLAYLKSGHVQILLAQQVYEWGTESVDRLYDYVANNKKPDEAFIKAKLIPVTKENVEEFGKNWDKWLGKTK